MLYVDNLVLLEEICNEFSASKWLALDTEFLRETTYFPKFCLLQIGNSDRIACIDPLQLETLEPLRKLLFNCSIIKVFHSARQDLEIFYHLFGAIPAPLFDTQIAAPLLGFSDQIGYAELVSEVIGVQLEKAHSRANWSNRPLPREQLKYAFEDVFYLGHIYQKMLDRLTEFGRENWLQEDFESLTHSTLYSNSPKLAWQRIRGTSKLSTVQLTILQAIAEWREKIAQQRNKPRNWVLKNDVIVDLARLQPENLETLERIRGLSSRTLKQDGSVLCTLIYNAKQGPPIRDNGNAEGPVKKTPEQEALLDLLMAVVRLRGADNSLNPNVLGPRKDLERLLFDSENAKLLRGWRKNLIGEELLAIIEGKRSLTIVDGLIRINKFPIP